MQGVRGDAARSKRRRTQVAHGCHQAHPQSRSNGCPSIGGEADLAQYLQVVPGVIFTGDQGGQLYIRGGSPIMNKTMMDGMVLYNPFHSIGLFSVFDNDIIRNADIYTGGLQRGTRRAHQLRHGHHHPRRQQDPPERKGGGEHLHGEGRCLEGPLKKQNEPGGGSASFLLNFRHSYLDQSSKIILRDTSRRRASLQVHGPLRQGQLQRRQRAASSTCSASTSTTGCATRT